MQKVRQITCKEVSAIVPIVDYYLDNGTVSLTLRLASGEEVVLIRRNQRLYRRLCNGDRLGNRPTYVWCLPTGYLRVIWWPTD